ncbi:MAG: Vitamin B12 dependent methionine synthase activation subunit [Coprococcus sp.]|nr:Vitamin B12 dependent methionine synthase activation subunit [Coprococcus sp.]
MADERTLEAVRYLGYGRHAVDERTLALVADSFKELESCARLKSVYRIFECHFPEHGRIMIGTMNIASKNLAKNLLGCRETAVFGATLGAEVDFLLKKYSLTDMAKAVVLQACAAAYLEEYCDEIQDKLAKEKAKEGQWLRPRFSPGYGDFDIHHQQEVLRMLDAPKKIGLTMTERYMLTPTKSVTAVIGISREKADCHRKGCEECDKTDCKYRRNERDGAV